MSGRSLHPARKIWQFLETKFGDNVLEGVGGRDIGYQHLLEVKNDGKHPYLKRPSIESFSRDVGFINFIELSEPAFVYVDIL
jgi:hypothetical protein